jgi:hypothetical protein
MDEESSLCYCAGRIPRSIDVDGQDREKTADRQEGHLREGRRRTLSSPIWTRAMVGHRYRVESEQAKFQAPRVVRLSVIIIAARLSAVQKGQAYKKGPPRRVAVAITRRRMPRLGMALYPVVDISCKRFPATSERIQRIQHTDYLIYRAEVF